MSEMDGLNDRCVCDCYLMRNSDKAKVDIAQTWLYNNLSR